MTHWFLKDLPESHALLNAKTPEPNHPTALVVPAPSPDPGRPNSAERDRSDPGFAVPAWQPYWDKRSRRHLVWFLHRDASLGSWLEHLVCAGALPCHESRRGRFVTFQDLKPIISIEPGAGWSHYLTDPRAFARKVQRPQVRLEFS
jgi:hypothetical protein